MYDKLDKYLADEFDRLRKRRDTKDFKTVDWEIYDGKMSTIYDLQDFVRFSLKGGN